MKFNVILLQFNNSHNHKAFKIFFFKLIRIKFKKIEKILHFCNLYEIIFIKLYLYIYQNKIFKNWKNSIFFYNIEKYKYKNKMKYWYICSCRVFRQKTKLEHESDWKTDCMF